MSLEKFRNATGPVYMTPSEGEQLGKEGLIQATPTQKDPTNNEAFLVTLTPAGQAQLDATAAVAAPVAPAMPVAPAAPAVPPSVPTAPIQPAPAVAAPQVPASGVGADAVPNDNVSPVETGFSPAPRKKRSGGAVRKSAYNYDKLEAPVLNPTTGTYEYQSFHVAPKEGESVEQLEKRMSSNTSAANRKYRENVIENGSVVMESVDKRTYNRTEGGDYVLDAAGKRTSVVTKVQQAKTVATRKFVVSQALEGDHRGHGVRVYRVELS